MYRSTCPDRAVPRYLTLAERGALAAEARDPERHGRPVSVPQKFPNDSRLKLKLDRVLC